MLDIVKTLEQLGFYKEAAKLKLAADQPDLFDENATQNIPEPVQEADRYQLFRERFPDHLGINDSVFDQRETLLRKHLYKIWLDNEQEKTSQELFDDVSSIPVEGLSKVWESAQKKYPHERVEQEDSRQMTLPMGQDVEIIVGPSKNEVKDLQHSYTKDLNQLKPLVKEFAANYASKYIYSDIIKESLNNPGQAGLHGLDSRIREYVSTMRGTDSRVAEIIKEISAITAPRDFWYKPTLSINAAFSELAVDLTVPKELYQEGLSNIKKLIDECNKLKAATHALLNKSDGQIYQEPGKLGDIVSTDQLEQWYERYCFYMIERIIRSDVGDKFFGTTRYANRGFAKLDSYFSSKAQRSWMEDQAEFAKWISSSSYDKNNIKALGGMSIDLWIAMKLAELEQYRLGLDTTFRALKSDLQWLQKIGSEYTVFTGTESEKKTLSNHIEVVREQFTSIRPDHNPLNSFLNRAARESNKTLLLSKMDDFYKDRIGAAKAKISREIFKPIAIQFYNAVSSEYLKWRTGLSSLNEELSLEKIYFAADRLAEIDTTKDYASAWKYPKLSPWPKEDHDSMSESAKRRIGISAISQCDKVIRGTTGVSALENLWKRKGNHPAFDGRSASEVLQTMLKNKEAIFAMLDAEIKIDVDFTSTSTFGSAAEAISDSVSLAYPALSSDSKTQKAIKNLYTRTFSIERDIRPFEVFEMDEIRNELQKLHAECSYGAFANTYLHHVGGVGPRAMKKAAEKSFDSLRQEKDNGSKILLIEDSTVPSLGNLAAAEFKERAKHYAENDSKKLIGGSHFVSRQDLGNDFLSSFIKNGDYNISTLSQIKVELIEHYKVSDESTLHKIISLNAVGTSANFDRTDLNKIKSFAFPDTIDKAIEALPTLMAFAGWVHNSGGTLDAAVLKGIWKNPNRRALLAGDNELIKSYFQLIQRLKGIGGYDGIVKKHGKLLDGFIKNSNIRRGFKKRILDFARLVKTGARLHPDVPGYDDAKSLIIELTTDLEVLENSQVVLRYAEQAKIKHKDLYKLNLRPDGVSSWRFRVLNNLDPYHFKVGADTNCCQALGQTGAAAAIDSFINPLAGVVLLEIHTQYGWKTVSQSYFHYIPGEKGYILDNVESNNKYEEMFETLTGKPIDFAYRILAKSLKDGGAKFFRCGAKYNKLDEKQWKSSNFESGDPRTFAVNKRYTDFSASNHLDLFKPRTEDKL